MEPDSPGTVVGGGGMALRFDHLARLSGPFGLFEHADHDLPRVHLGYTTDDNARALVVLCRLPALPQEVGDLFDCYLRFVARGRTSGGWHNRLGPDGRWQDHTGSDDCHGRALWGLGVAAARAPEAAWRDTACEAFEAAAPLPARYPRANAYAAIGAAAALAAADPPATAVAVLEKAAAALPRPRAGPWRWPEGRLTYANARLPEALMAAGTGLDRPDLVEDGLALLEWLVDIERGAGGFSFTPVGGRGPAHVKPAFDQQPIEAWAMADAAHLGWRISGDERWEERWRLACAWFLGANDVGVALYDADTGAGFDGLTATGVNHNRGAESTLAALGSLALLQSVGGVPPPGEA